MVNDSSGPSSQQWVWVSTSQLEILRAKQADLQDLFLLFRGTRFRLPGEPREQMCLWPLGRQRKPMPHLMFPLFFPGHWELRPESCRTSEGRWASERQGLRVMTVGRENQRPGNGRGIQEITWPSSQVFR